MMSDLFGAFIGIVCGVGLTVAVVAYNGGFALKDDVPETGAVFIHCEGDRDYVAPKDEYYVIVRSGRIYIYANGSSPAQPVLIIKQPVCGINWNAEPAKQQTTKPAPALPRARTLEEWAL